MPQPMNRVVPNAQVYLDGSILKDKPAFALLSCEIFSTWAQIEHEQNFLFVRVLGANAAPAIAIYGELRTQALQLAALEAAAKAALSPADYEIFAAATAVVDGAKTPRNHLAHWAWGGCRERSDLLALVNPKALKERDFRVARH